MITGVGITGWLVNKLGELERSGPEFVKAGCVAIAQYLQGTIAAGTAPDGTPWEPRKRDGGKPLRNAASGLTVTPLGNGAMIRLTGHWVHHHYSTRGRVRRLVIPTQGMPDKLGNAIRLGFADVFRRKMR